MKGMTIERHILEMERSFPEATGTFSDILHGIAAAGRRIAREVRRAGLTDILGEEGSTNVHGEVVKKLDLYAHDALVHALDHRGHLCAIASEEEEYVLPIPDHHPTGAYCLLFDPLDGSSNIDVNVTVGTIFSVHRRVSEGSHGQLEDCLQPGHRQVAAGYVVYGSSTMLVYTTGAGVYGFTLDPGVGEFLLSHERIVIPEPGERVCSVNAGNFRAWTPAQQGLFESLRRPDGGHDPFGFRYVGSMVADVHRILLEGGLFMYPAEAGSPAGKLRLLYEAAPMAMIVEQAGGRASDGRRRVLDLQPAELHQRTPLYLGTGAWVEKAEAALAEDAAG